MPRERIYSAFRRMILPVMDTDARQRMAPPMPLRRRVGANAPTAAALVASARLLLKTAEPRDAGLRNVALFFRNDNRGQPDRFRSIMLIKKPNTLRWRSLGAMLRAFYGKELI